MDNTFSLRDLIPQRYWLQACRCLKICGHVSNGWFFSPESLCEALCVHIISQISWDHRGETPVCSPRPGLVPAWNSLCHQITVDTHFGVFRVVSTPAPLFNIFLALPLWDDRLQHVKAGRIFVLISKCCRLGADVPRIPQTYGLTFVCVLCWAACEPGSDLYLLIACTLVDLQLKISGLFFNYKWFILSRCMELKLRS